MLSQKHDVQETEKADVCCLQFEPEKWDDVQHTWNEKSFLMDTVPEIFHIPLPGTYAKAIGRMWKKAQDAGAAPDVKDFLLLAHDPTAFKSKLYMSVKKEVAGGRNLKLSGTFLSKVFEGPYSDVGKCIDQMNQFLEAGEMKAKKHYVYFPYCPKCAKKYGHNYIVVMSEVQRH